jgi:hypothetical protein
MSPTMRPESIRFTRTPRRPESSYEAIRRRSLESCCRDMASGTATGGLQR